MGKCEFFRFIIIVGLLVVTGHGSTVDEILELNGHRAGIYISQENDANHNSNNSKIVYLFKKISKKIGAYGLFSYERNYNLAYEMKILFESAIERNVAVNGQTMGKWKTILKRTMSEMEKILIKKLNEAISKTELLVAITVVDEYKVTQAKWIPKASSESQETPSRNSATIFSENVSKTRSIESGIDVFTADNTKFLYMSAGYLLKHDEEHKAEEILENEKDWKNAAKNSIIFAKKCDKEADKNIGVIVIELEYGKNGN